VIASARQEGIVDFGCRGAAWAILCVGQRMLRVECDFHGWTHYRDLTPTQRTNLKKLSNLGERETKRIYKRWAACLLELAAQEAAGELVRPDVLEATPQTEVVRDFVRLSSQLDGSFQRMTAVTRGGLEVRLRDYRSAPSDGLATKAPPEEQSIELAVNVLRALVAMSPKRQSQGRPQTPPQIRRVARQMVRVWVDNGGKPSLSKNKIGLAGLVPEVIRLNPIAYEIRISPMSEDREGKPEKSIKYARSLSDTGTQIVGQLRSAVKKIRSENRR
jgi:hypothetical protein